MSCKLYFISAITIIGLVVSISAQDDAKTEKQLFSQLFAPNATVLPTAETLAILDQLQNIYITRMYEKQPVGKEELRRRMQVFSLASMGTVNQTECKAERFYGYANAIQFLADFKNVASYLENKQADLIKLCKDSNLPYVEL